MRNRISTKHSDKRLVKKAVSGDLKAYRKLFGRYQDQILYLSYDILGNYNRAKEVSEQVFLTAMEKLSDFGNTISFSAWLYRIVITKSLEVREEYYGDPDTIIETKLGQKQFKRQTVNVIKKNQISSSGLNDDIKSALLKLTTDQNIAIILNYFHKKSIREIAEIMDWNVDTVRINIIHAAEKLKSLL
jgi:RNA polymerase sigma-70 factor (ECF subfamily)